MKTEINQGKTNQATAERLLFLSCVLAYFPSMVISNIAGLKINYILALCLISLTFTSLALKQFKIEWLYFFLLSMLFILLKTILIGTYNLKPVLISIIGFPIVFRFIELYKRLPLQIKRIAFLATISISIIFCIILVLQFLNILPNKLGNISFVNTAGVSITGEYSSEERPSAYFYHPYDAALAIMPLIVFLRYSKTPYLVSLFLATLITFILGLKVLIIFTILFFLINTKFIEKIKPIWILVFFIILGTSLISILNLSFSSQIISITAGRLFIWDLMLEEYQSNATLLNYIFGYNRDLLASSPGWLKEDTYTPHNQFLFSVFYAGGALFIVFLFLFLRLINFEKKLIPVIALMVPTFAMTGDLMVFMGFWVCMTHVYIIVSYNEAD